MPDRAISTNRHSTNPFTTKFGRVPTYFAGREDVIDDITQDLSSVSEGVCGLFVGPRGTGKTSLLSYFSDIAEKFGWISVNASAIPGMLDDIFQQAEYNAGHLLEAVPKRKLKGASISGIASVEWENIVPENANWRTNMTRILDALEEKDIGLFITVDEVDPELNEMVELVSFYQHFVRENRRVSLLMAGLPYNVNALIKGKSTSFLRRADRYDLGPLSDFEVKEAFRLTVEEGGRLIEKPALDLATKGIGGFPFMFQLVGYRAWRASKNDDLLTIEDIQVGIELANDQLRTQIFDATYVELSPGDRDFLNAMLKDDDESSRDALMRRLKKTSGHITTYKNRLIQAGIIDETIDKNLRFVLPGFKEYLKDHLQA